MIRRGKRIFAVLAGLFLFVLVAGCGKSGGQAEAQDRSKQVIHTVTFYQQDVVVSRQRIPEGGCIPIIPTGAAWQNESGIQVEPSKITVTQALDFYVQENSYITRDQRCAFPYESSRYCPDAPLTRGEVVQIIYALLEDAPVTLPAGIGSVFADVQPTEDCYSAVRMLTYLGLLKGDGSGLFLPDRIMTRAELATLLCRVVGCVGVRPESAFADVPEDHWAADSINSAAADGWLLGYDDGRFYPDRPVTRAEAMTMINRARGRTPNRTLLDLVCRQYPYVDVPPEGWAYENVVDLTFTNELLQLITGQAPHTQPGFTFVGERMCHVNPETLRLDYYQAGFHTIADGLDSDGLYYVGQDGYYIERFSTGYIELDGSLFYVPETDGPFATDYKKGYLYFGENGRYTSGSEVVDAYVDELMADILNNPATSGQQKLYQAYCLIRDGDFQFMNRNTGWRRGATSFTLECAEVFFQTKRGSCYYWASGYMYLARRLGYQARCVVGGAGSLDVLHCWVVIKIDGEDYIFDPEMEWAFMYGHYDGTVRMIDLFMQPRNYPSYVYHFPE